MKNPKPRIKLATIYVWGFPPESDTIKIPKELYEIIKARLFKRITSIAPRIKLNIRFRAEFCYIDSIEDGHNMPLCRLHYYGDIESWGLGFYTYSNEKYTDCMFASGSLRGSLEGALDACRIYF